MKKRIDWTDYEQAQVFAATRDLLATRGIKLPISDPKSCSLFVAAMRDAQVALPMNRRRPIASIDAVGGGLRERFVSTGVLPRDFSSLRRGASKQSEEPDPRDERIKELEKELAESERACEEQVNEAFALGERIKELEARPDAMSVVRAWVSRTLADALILAEDAKRPAAVRIDPDTKQPLPAFERERRKDPERAASPAGVYKPKLAIIGGLPADHRAISDDFEDSRVPVDLRYFSSMPGNTVYDAIKQIASSGGAVLLWNDHAHQSVEVALKSRAISYHRHEGNLMSVISRLHGFAETLKAKHEGRAS